MPIIELKTNLKSEQIPADLEARFNKHFGPQWNKELSRMVFTVHSSQRMTIGDDSTKPVIMLRIWSFSVFDNLEVRNKSSVEIYKFLYAEFPELEHDRIRVLLHDMPKIDVGPRS